MSKITKKDLLEETRKEVELLITNEVKKAKTDIEYAINQDGPFTHNMICMTLASLARKCGEKYANELVTEYDLTNLYGIEQEE